MARRPWERYEDGFFFGFVTNPMQGRSNLNKLPKQTELINTQPSRSRFQIFN
jgi:hypothetical protein